MEINGILIGTYIISFYFQNNNLWSHFFWLYLFYRWELNQAHAPKKWKTQDLNPSCWIPKSMLLTITLKITVITSGHHKDILTLSPKCLKPVSVFTLSSIGAEHKKLLVLKKSFNLAVLILPLPLHSRSRSLCWIRGPTITFNSWPQIIMPKTQKYDCMAKASRRRILILT